MLSDSGPTVDLCRVECAARGHVTGHGGRYVLTFMEFKIVCESPDHG